MFFADCAFHEEGIEQTTWLNDSDPQLDRPILRRSSSSVPSRLSVVANQFQYHLRTFSTALADVRSDGINDWSTSSLKQFSLSERKFLRLRVELFNFINRATFAAANSAFRTITSQANRPSTFQVVALSCSRLS